MLHRIAATAMPPAEYQASIPGSWERRPSPSGAGAEFFNRRHKVAVLVSVDTMDDGAIWLHVSCSRRDRLPSWEDLRWVKNLFIGTEREAFQCLPKESEYVNLHPYCLHLWCPLGRS